MNTILTKLPLIAIFSCFFWVNSTAQPDCRSISQPINGSVNQPLNPTSFIWEASTSGEPTTDLVLRLSASPDLSFPLNVSLPVNFTSVGLDGLSFYTTYYWSIIPSNANGEAVGCPVYSFTTIGDGSGQSCAQAIPITEGAWASPGILANCSGTDVVNACFNSNANSSMWFVYTPAFGPGVCTVSSSIDPDQPDTRLSVFDSCGSTTCLASDDDSGLGFTSEASFLVNFGQSYYLQWDDRWNDGQFDFQISLANILNGCTDEFACNYNASANNDDGTCIDPVSCDDGNDCTIDGPDMCDVNDCVNTPIDCDDGIECNFDYCENGICVNTLNCDDGIGCTFDACVNGVCSNAIFCEDGDPCTTDICEYPNCVFTPINCDDGDDCTIDICDNGICINTPIDCDDGDVNTTDSCENGICINTPIGPGSSCENAIPAEYGSNSSPGIAFSGGPNPSNACFGVGASNSIWYVLTTTCPGTTTISSDTGPGIDTRLSVHSSCDNFDCIAFNDDIDVNLNFASEVSFATTAGATYYIEWDDRWSSAAFEFDISQTNDCDDGDPCTIDDCINSTCVYIPINCDDGDDCTIDICDNGICIHTPIDCDDGDDCTIDICDNGICINTPIDCDDGDDNTADSCVQGNCVNTPLGPGQSCLNAIAVTYGITSTPSIASSGGPTATNACFVDVGTNSIWYAFTPTCSGITRISSGVDPILPDTRLSVHSDCNNFDCIAFNDDIDADNGNYSSEVTFISTANETYYIEWDDRWSSSDAFEFEISNATNSCPTDLNFDGTTDGDDFSIFLGNYGIDCVDACDCETDLNGDGTTDGDDFSIFLGNYGLACTPLD